MKKLVVGFAAFLTLWSCAPEESNTASQRLPITITRWKGNGDLNYRQDITYDSQHRISKIDITESNASLNRTITYTYASGKIIRNFNYTDPTQTDYEYVLYHRFGKVTKEEVYHGGQLSKEFNWTHNTDGTKIVQCTNGSGGLEYVFRYYFNELGNCTSVRIDFADTSKKDVTVTYDNYDNHPRALYHHDWLAPWSEIPELIRQSQFTNEPQLPNNPGNYTYKPDGEVPTQNYIFDYQYDANGNVVFQKTLVGGSLLHTIVYDYATLE
ncbi:hypothetical protein [Flavobacterium sp. GCM10027622]|uniref:hypothetical protein n=1 Tax=unclassified Flavobacterium TaxID=196869 RepID=UPI003615E43F